jgi:ABC-type proline/glycine betaine transport system substrate-binding protein
MRSYDSRFCDHLCLIATPDTEAPAMMLDMKNGKSVDTVVIDWIKAHPKMVDSWVS